MYCWGTQHTETWVLKGYVAASDVNHKIKIPVKVEIPQSKSVSFMGVGEYHGCAVMTDSTLLVLG